MASGLIALLDDVAGLAKIAAATIDDAAGQAARAGVKAAGVVIDDAAVTPRYVTGFASNRELPIVGKIALGSLKNKMIFLLPGALLLSTLAPWAINPLLMFGGLFLCFEGAEKVHEALWPHAPHDQAVAVTAIDPEQMEQQKVAGAIKTDFILSAEIMALTIATVPEATFTVQAIVLALVGIGITGVVYGAVALIVKADDAGLALATSEAPVSSLVGRSRAVPSGADRAMRPVTQAIGRGIVRGMPWLLRVLSVVGTAAMIWVGGGILIHGVEVYGWTGPGHAIAEAAQAAAATVPGLAGLVSWAVSAAAAGVVGLVVGVALIPVVTRVLAPSVRRVRATLFPAEVAR